MRNSRRAPWSKQREAQHKAAYPQEEKRERNRAAQARYRARHAARLAAARRIRNILMSGGDVDALAAALRVFFNKQGMRELRKELVAKLK